MPTAWELNIFIKSGQFLQENPSHKLSDIMSERDIAYGLTTNYFYDYYFPGKMKLVH